MHFLIDDVFGKLVAAALNAVSVLHKNAFALWVAMPVAMDRADSMPFFVWALKKASADCAKREKLMPLVLAIIMGQGCAVSVMQYLKWKFTNKGFLSTKLMHIFLDECAEFGE